MNGFLLLIPSILIRYLLLFLLSKEAMKRAAHFAPLAGAEKIAYWIYQISTLSILIYSFFLKVNVQQSWLFYIGVALYVIGLAFLILSMVTYSSPSSTGINLNGLYRLSRNPIYVSYFICFLGCAALTQSFVLLGFVFLFQISAHWIILSEERWCIEKFGVEYQEYMKKVRRYI